MASLFPREGPEFFFIQTPPTTANPPVLPYKNLLLVSTARTLFYSPSPVTWVVVTAFTGSPAATCAPHSRSTQGPGEGTVSSPPPPQLKSVMTLVPHALQNQVKMLGMISLSPRLPRVPPCIHHRNNFCLFNVPASAPPRDAPVQPPPLCQKLFPTLPWLPPGPSSRLSFCVLPQEASSETPARSESIHEHRYIHFPSGCHACTYSSASSQWV